eukprot:CAMPEP_0114227742 /NCGR_PEP_ID=MMETSP0058-20121206/1952_1 /TAXON_ID=36894 /ORGANISM="Pyramimonas parkeae, CCMP726" /LENGTH=138 /DNA_ID=CAMNT_0001338603 /DNA_START=368 /DNA_END=781 /DNA_ORIENTATION=-
MFAASEFKMLNDMLNSSTELEEEQQLNANSKITPASFGGPAPTRAQIDALPKVKVWKDPKAIWDADELEDNIDDDIDDGRERPKYEFLYRQAVGTEDAYLGSNDKDPSSTCCEVQHSRVLLGLASLLDTTRPDLWEVW